MNVTVTVLRLVTMTMLRLVRSNRRNVTEEAAVMQHLAPHQQVRPLPSLLPPLPLPRTKRVWRGAAAASAPPAPRRSPVPPPSPSSTTGPSRPLCVLGHSARASVCAAPASLQASAGAARRRRCWVMVAAAAAALHCRCAISLRNHPCVQDPSRWCSRCGASCDSVSESGGGGWRRRKRQRHGGARGGGMQGRPV
jgi:hypothetical protein